LDDEWWGRSTSVITVFANWLVPAVVLQVSEKLYPFSFFSRLSRTNGHFSSMMLDRRECVFAHPA
jgi:hypothetical protein